MGINKSPDYELDVNGDVRISGSGLISGSTSISSDSRIKKNIVDINDDEALVQLRQIQPKKYNYIDTKSRTSERVYGFIAQQVRGVIPDSTSERREYIPDIYSYGEIDFSNNCIKILQKLITINDEENSIITEDISLNLNIEIGDWIQCYSANNVMFDFKIEDIKDENVIVIDPSSCALTNHKYYRNLMDSSNNTFYDNLVFIYGKLVKDFTYLKKDAIWTVATAALQEVDRQQQSDKVRISELETEVVTLETEVATLKNQISTFESQMSELLTRISSLENNSSTTTDASDNTTSTDGS